MFRHIPNVQILVTNETERSDTYTQCSETKETLYSVYMHNKNLKDTKDYTSVCQRIEYYEHWQKQKNANECVYLYWMTGQKTFSSFLHYNIDVEYWITEHRGAAVCQSESSILPKWTDTLIK